jgi:DNA-binding response OmpR family regulator
MLNPTVLLCGPGIRDTCAQALVDAGLQVTRTTQLSGALDSYLSQRPDLVVLAEDDPSTGLHEVIRRLRVVGSVPVVVACDRPDDVSQLMAFAAGADDVVPTDVAPRVLVARIGAVLRRTVAGPTAMTPAREVGPFRLDSESRTASVAGSALDLTRIEFDLLGILLEAPDRVVPRDELVTRVWGSWFGDDHVVEVHLSRLRAKVVRLGGPRIGVAVRGVGYRLGLRTPIAV